MAKRKSRHKSSKKKAWEWCSKYIRLRDAVAYTQKTSCQPVGFVACCTCGKLKHWKEVDAGHFIGRGLGGGSGVYFDERNIHAQCKPCNAFGSESQIRYKEFMLEKYGQKVIDELRIKHHKGGKYLAIELEALAQYYKAEYEKLLQEL